jgi:hypothetical protein
MGRRRSMGSAGFRQGRCAMPIQETNVMIKRIFLDDIRETGRAGQVNTLEGL